MGSTNAPLRDDEFSILWYVGTFCVFAYAFYIDFIKEISLTHYCMPA